MLSFVLDSFISIINLFVIVVIVNYLRVIRLIAVRILTLITTFASTVIWNIFPIIWNTFPIISLHYRHFYFDVVRFTLEAHRLVIEVTRQRAQAPKMKRITLM